MRERGNDGDDMKMDLAMGMTMFSQEIADRVAKDGLEATQKWLIETTPHDIMATMLCLYVDVLKRLGLVK